MSEMYPADRMADKLRQAAHGTGAHDQTVMIVGREAKKFLPGLRLQDLKETRPGSGSFRVTRLQAELWIARLESIESATMPVVPKTTPERTTAMPTVDLPERSMDALVAIKSLGACTARQVAVEVAGSEDKATDSRGWAQTIRRLVSDHGYVERNDKGEYKLTSSGRSAVNRILKARASETESVPGDTDTEPVTD